MRKNKVEAMEEYKKYTAGVNKDLINLVVVGHVDSGKSTLMGHLLVELGMVSNKMSINNNNFWSQAFLNKKIHCAQGELTLFLNDYFCVTNMLKQHNMLF